MVEAELQSTKPIIEASAASATQVDSPTPTIAGNGESPTGALMEPLPATPRVQDPPSPGLEMLYPDAEVESEALSPPAKRPATLSPSPLAALADSHAYPPAFHGPTGKSRATSQPATRGRPLTQTRAAATAADVQDPPDLSPKREFFKSNFAQSQTDSPLQDHSTVKKAKPSDSGKDAGDAIPQDLNDKFDNLADITIEPLAFPTNPQ